MLKISSILRKLYHLYFAKIECLTESQVGVGALLQSGGDNHKARSGRAINIPLLQAGWNNRHHQAMDSSNEGQTCIQNVLEGKFYHEKHPSVTTKDFCRGSRGAEIDKKLNQPLVKSLIEGEYYFTKYDHVAKNRKHTNFISQNRRLAADYSQFMIDARRSMHELSMDPSRTATPQISVPLAKYSRLRKSTSRQSYDYGSQSLLSLSMYPNSGSEVGSQRTSRRGGSIRLGKSDHTVTHTIGNTRSISRRPQSATHLRTEIADFSFDEGHSKPVSRSPGHVQPSMLPPPPRYGVDKKILADATAVARSRINGVRLDPETRRAK
ncbi:hypothetical protein GUITHDRAFT_110860 [Guillardia theta CCMP2712]|uniref:Uncharacterized protein n=1 Tax=Guillardia theta (strain CCMP2712) TaxID=905079 RepID=L1J468_GUITC|nr:hypothetical protein GUITHDRAFT_110860 [Guillardia theta CCMP2712]EKX43132.1 hypothetical protein GUITHDRAFT_110860 [Guillardia theta CCMP2712]|eukprot:XP_005830112.1 hypothetical protein GUITHDRAFT_110860 [Guillardia theta CCMP2712]